MERSDNKMELRVVPWYSAAEFRQVYERIFSSEIKEKNWAVDTISVWRTRADPCLPAAIELTYLLTSTVIQDALFIANKAPIRQNAIELQYIYAIIRFVNLTLGVHEKEIDRMLRKQQIAQQLGIPSYIVVLSNQGSHETMSPPLGQLRLAAEDALTYLKKSYWDKEAEKVQNLNLNPPENIEIKETIGRYMRKKLEIVYGMERDISEESRNEVTEEIACDYENAKELTKRIKKIERKRKKKMASKNYEEMDETQQLRSCLIAIDKLLVKDKTAFVDVFVTEFFIPRDGEMKYFVDRQTFDLFTDMDDEHVDNNPNSIPSLSSIPEIPKLHEDLWLPVIDRLNMNNAVNLFLEKLLQSQGNRTVVGQKMVISWAMNFLKICSDEGRKNLSAAGKNLKCLFKKKGIAVNWKYLFTSMLMNPCKYTPLLLPWITRHCDIDKNKVDRCLALLAIYLCQTVDEATMIQYNMMFTVEDIKKEKRRRKKKFLKELDECLFIEKVEDDRIKAVPFGTLFPVKQTVKEEEDDQVVPLNEEQEFKVEYVIGGSKHEDIDWEEVIDYSKCEESVGPDYNELLKEVIKRKKENKSFLYKQQ